MFYLYYFLYNNTGDFSTAIFQINSSLTHQKKKQSLSFIWLVFYWTALALRSPRCSYLLLRVATSW